MALVKLNNRGVRSATTFGSITGLGSMVFIKKLTSSSSATLSFVDGSSDVVLDDTYKEYLFTFNNMHPATDSAHFQFNMSVDTGSNYNVTKTTTFFHAAHRQDAAVTELSYDTGQDLAQSTNFQRLAYNIDGSHASDNLSGYLHLFNPSSTTFVKHFIATNNYTYDGDGDEQYSYNIFVGGYFNTTTAITRLQFKFESGNIDAGDICLYGIN